MNVNFTFITYYILQCGECLAVVQKIVFELTVEISVLGYPDLKNVVFRQCLQVCMTVESKRLQSLSLLNHFLPNIHQTCTLGQHMRARNYKKKLNQPLFCKKTKKSFFLQKNGFKDFVIVSKKPIAQKCALYMFLYKKHRLLHNVKLQCPMDYTYL